MKRLIITGAAAALIIVALLAVFRPGWFGFEPHIKANAAVLLDIDSGEIWMNKNGDKAMPPASISKMMTQLLVLDCISSGTCAWEEKVTVSAYASTVGGATLSLKQNESYMVKEMYEAITVYSANDAAIALAEYIAGSEEDFVRMMNDRAESLGMSRDTRFGNATGLKIGDLGPNRPAGIAEGETRMTAKDAAQLAAALIRTHPEVLRTTSMTQMQLKGKGLYVSNTNLMLPSMGGDYAYTGMDGLKTGYDSRSGYSIAGTAQRDGVRLVAVVMGAESRQDRYEGTAKLLDYGFYLGLPAWGKMKHIMDRFSSIMG